MKPTTFLFLFCLAFLVSAASNQITSTPYYWTETLPSSSIAVMPDTTFTFGNSTNGPLNVALRTPNTFDINTNYQAQFFYPYNTSTGLNTSFSGKLIMRGFRAYFSGAAPVVTWHLQQTNTGNGCNGTDLATGTLQAEGGGAWEDATGINAVLEAGKSHCLRFDATSTVSAVIGGDDNGAGDIYGYRGSTTALANWAWDTGDELGIQFNFTEYIPVRSPLITTNRSNGNVSFALERWVGSTTSRTGTTIFSSGSASCLVYLTSGNTGNMCGIRNDTLGYNMAIFYWDGTTLYAFSYKDGSGLQDSLGAYAAGNYTLKVEVIGSQANYYVNGRFVWSRNTNVPTNPKWVASAIESGTGSLIFSQTVENVLPSGASVQLWANGSGIYGLYAPIVGSQYALTILPHHQYSTNYEADGFFYPESAGYMNITYPTVVAPQNYVLSNCLVTIPTYTFAAGDNITGYVSANGTDYVPFFSRTASGLNDTTDNVTSKLGASSTQMFVMTKAFNPNVGSSLGRTVVGYYALNCTLSNSSALSLPVLVSGANNVSATTSNGSTNYSITTLQTNPLQNNPNYANWTTWQNQNASITYSAYTPAGQFLTATGQAYVGGTARNSATAFNVSTVTSGYNRTDITTINWTVTAPSETLKVNTTETSLVVYTPANALMNCSFLSSTVALNFSTLWEGNRTTVLSTQAGTFTYRVNSTDDTTPYNYSSSASQVFSWPICLYPSWATAWVNSTQEYYNNSAEKRNYYLSNASITNTSNAITLYVPEPEAQLVQITLKDGNGVSQAGYYISFQRYFIDTNSYSEVARGLTSANGDTTLWLRPNDVIYNIVIYNASGGVTATYTQQNIPCDPAVSICTITMFLPTVSTAQAYQTLGTTSYSCTLTNSSANCTFIDTSGLSRNFTLAITKHGSLLTYEVCRTWLSTASGSLYCNATDWTANTRYSYNFWGKFASFDAPLESGWLPYLEAPAFGTSGILIALFLALIMGLVGAWSPTVSLGFGVLVLIASLGMGLLPAAAAYGAVLGFTVLAIMFMVKMNS